MLTKGKFLVSFEVPGHTKEYTEGFTEEMVIPYRTEELNPYLRYPTKILGQNVSLILAVTKMITLYT